MEYLWSPWRMEYIQNHKKEPDCVFCRALANPDDPESLVVYIGQNVIVILNRFPYTSGHLLVVPFEHLPSIAPLAPAVRAEMMDLSNKAIRVLSEIYHPQGFNLGINIGEAAGAGITEHVHMHIVPRWTGDTNFMSSLGQTRVLPETLEDTYQRIKSNWSSILSLHT